MTDYILVVIRNSNTNTNLRLILWFVLRSAEIYCVWVILTIIVLRCSKKFSNGLHIRNLWQINTSIKNWKPVQL